MNLYEQHIINSTIGDVTWKLAALAVQMPKDFEEAFDDYQGRAQRALKLLQACEIVSAEYITEEMEKIAL